MTRRGRVAKMHGRLPLGTRVGSGNSDSVTAFDCSAFIDGAAASLLIRLEDNAQVAKFGLGGGMSLCLSVIFIHLILIALPRLIRLD